MLPIDRRPVRTALAIQGGGAHGAFAWGVVDRLLEDGLRFDAVTGVSSGALIAAMAVQGFVRDGAKGARAAMAALWDGVASANIFGPVSSTLDKWMWGIDLSVGHWSGANWGGTNWGVGNWGREIGTELLSSALRFFNPTQLNPFGQNPLRPILEALLDPDALCDPSAPRLFVAATDVETGLATIFDNAQIDVDVLLATSCLPMLFPTVMIGGRGYWDGGYSANPALTPVLALDPTRLILVRAQSRTRKGVPTSTGDIVHRLHEIAFQAPIEAELADLPRGVRLHDIAADEALAALPMVSKMNTEREFLTSLFTAGRLAASRADAA